MQRFHFKNIFTDQQNVRDVSTRWNLRQVNSLTDQNHESTNEEEKSEVGENLMSETSEKKEEHVLRGNVPLREAAYLKHTHTHTHTHTSTWIEHEDRPSSKHTTPLHHLSPPQAPPTASFTPPLISSALLHLHYQLSASPFTSFTHHSNITHPSTRHTACIHPASSRRRRAARGNTVREKETRRRGRRRRRRRRRGGGGGRWIQRGRQILRGRRVWDELSD